MAKNLISIICVLFLFSCHFGRLSEARIENSEPTYLDSAIADIPVVVDTNNVQQVNTIDTLSEHVGKVTDTQHVQVREDIIAQLKKQYAGNLEGIAVHKKESFIDTVKLLTEGTHKYDTLRAIYTSTVGVREATGKNDGYWVEIFLKSVGLGPSFAWCAAGVKYDLLKAGVTEASRINGMALSCENKNNYVFKSGKLLKQIQPGDVFTLWYASLGRIGHTGFADKQINSSFYESVEGNTNVAGSREGDGKYRKRRSYNATYSITRWITES